MPHHRRTLNARARQRLTGEPYSRAVEHFRQVPRSLMPEPPPHQAVFEYWFFMAIARDLWPGTVDWVSPAANTLEVHIKPSADLETLALMLLPYFHDGDEVAGVPGLRATELTTLARIGVRLSHITSGATIDLTGLTPDQWDRAVDDVLSDAPGVVHRCFDVADQACAHETAHATEWPIITEWDSQLGAVGSALLRRAGLIRSVPGSFDAWHGHPPHIAGEFVLRGVDLDEVRLAFFEGLTDDGAFELFDKDPYHAFVRHVPSGQTADLRFLRHGPAARSATDIRWERLLSRAEKGVSGKNVWMGSAERRVI